MNTPHFDKVLEMIREFSCDGCNTVLITKLTELDQEIFKDWKERFKKDSEERMKEMKI